MEVLRFRTAPERVREFIEKDALAYDGVLTGHPAFMGKEVWTNPAAEGEVTVVIWWADNTFHEIPREQLNKLRTRFDEGFGAGYERIDSAEYVWAAGNAL